LNRLVDDTGATRSITGIYVSPGSCGSAPRTEDVDWGHNLIKRPIAPGKLASLFIDTPRAAGFNIRVDFDGTDAAGKPYQYFHTGAVLHKKGVIVHHALHRLKDGSSPWKLDRVIDKEFVR
ncbi:MAG: hypothetical protein ABW223_05540, partial [Rariglobus sp.]